MALEPANLTDFRLGGPLGGPPATVYEAVHLASGRPVAIKLLPASPVPGPLDGADIATLAAIRSRHVCEILGFGSENGQPFLVVELLRGESLDAKLRRDGPVPLPIAATWIEQLLLGIRDCHEARILHRDVKPSNVFLHRDGEGEVVKVTDVGIARLREVAGHGPFGDPASPDQVIASLGYMAPEQIAHPANPGVATDLYAIGVVIFRMITGRLPFISRSPEALLRMKSEQPVPKLSSIPGMIASPMLDGFIERATVRDPAWRFQSAREMLEHWWSVMASLDPGEVTEAAPDAVGRVDESYAGERPRPPPPSIEGEAEELTVRRVAPVTLADPPAPARAIPATLVSSAPPPLPLPSIEPPAFATAQEEPATTRDDDPYEVPTRSDPNLKWIVERELELQKARKER